jgi:hypothetical protein
VHSARRARAGIGQHLVGQAIGHDLDVAVEVGPEDRELRPSAQRRQRLRRRVAVFVALARRDDGGGGPDGVEQAGRGRGARSVVADLQHVHRRQDTTGHERCLDWRLRIPGQQRGEAAVAEQHHDRAVVDVAFGQWRGRIGLARVQDLDRRGRIQCERLPRAAERSVQHRFGGRLGQEMVVGRILECDAGVEEGTNAESFEHADQAGDVILVRVAEHQNVDPMGVERQVRAQATQGQLRIGTAVDEHRGAGGRLDQDRVALADVEHGQVQPSVRA